VFLASLLFFLSSFSSSLYLVVSHVCFRPLSSRPHKTFATNQDAAIGTLASVIASLPVLVDDAC
jgi:hypothetical protein